MLKPSDLFELVSYPDFGVGRLHLLFGLEAEPLELVDLGLLRHLLLRRRLILPPILIRARISDREARKAAVRVQRQRRAPVPYRREKPPSPRSSPASINTQGRPEQRAGAWGICAVE